MRRPVVTRNAHDIVVPRGLILQESEEGNQEEGKEGEYISAAGLYHLRHPMFAAVMTILTMVKMVVLLLAMIHIHSKMK